MSLNIVLLGLGQVGSHLAQVLSRENHNIVAIDSNPVQCRDADESLDIKLIDSDADRALTLADELHRTLVIHGDGRDFNLLATEGILETDALVSATDARRPIS